MFRESFERRREKSRPGRDKSGGGERRGGPGKRGVNYCRCIRRSLPIVMDSSVSLVFVACLWQPWNPPSFRHDSPRFLLWSSSFKSAAAMQKRPRGCPLKAKLKGRTFGGELETDGAARSERIREVPLAG